jgi:hypothetical protein
VSPETSILEENSSFSTLENIVDRKYAICLPHKRPFVTKKKNNKLPL